MRYEYPGGVSESEKDLVEKFERDVLPFCEKEGPYIGDAAMKGDKNAELIIRSTNLFINGLPELRQSNFTNLVTALKRWEKRT